MLLQSLLRPVLTPLMRGMFDPSMGSPAWSPLALWPGGIATPGMWSSPRDLTSQWADYTGTTPVSVPGTVADSANPVGLALDIRAGATVLTDPGNHMLQSTSAARPLLSARVNLLQYTEDFGNAGWLASGFAKTNGFPDPSGGSTATKLDPIPDSFAYLLASIPSTGNSPGCVSIYMRGETGGEVVRIINTSTTDVTLTTSWARYEFSETDLAEYLYIESGNPTASFGSFYIWHPQVEIGTTATDYQSVPGNGSTYATGFPIAQIYDGVDDGMATAAFAAGTLIDGMDCLIAVRRDSAASCVAGLYNGIADATKFFGMAESASGSGCVGSGAGTPTVWVDNVQLTGGTAVTRGTLHTALTAGSYHILEFRNLDLSTWTAAGFGLYTSYLFPGARGDIMLFPSTASTADKNAARADLAAYYGVTLA